MGPMKRRSLCLTFPRDVRSVASQSGKLAHHRTRDPPHPIHCEVRTRRRCPTSALRPRSSLDHFHEIASTAASPERQPNGSCPRTAPRANRRHASALVELVGPSRSEASAPEPQTLEPMQNELAPKCVPLQSPLQTFWSSGRDEQQDARVCIGSVKAFAELLKIGLTERDQWALWGAR